MTEPEDKFTGAAWKLGHQAAQTLGAQSLLKLQWKKRPNAKLPVSRCMSDMELAQWYMLRVHSEFNSHSPLAHSEWVSAS